jgi:ferredoxin-NADP reductase
MEKHIVKILDAFYITHDVKCFRIEKPVGYDYEPGQATEIAINLTSWEDKLRPFTFTSLRTDDYLEFMIKIYRDHEGVTNKLGTLNAGAELILHNVFGAIRYKEKGVFIAAGSGITPFISIFRDLNQKKALKGNRLLYTNKTSHDVIIGKELSEMLQEDFVNVYTREGNLGFTGKRIDRNFLIDTIVDFSQHFYVCGPDDFVHQISRLLIDLGVTSDTLVVEK